MANHSKERTQAEAQLKKTQKAQRATEGSQAMSEYVAAGHAVRAKTARLRELRLVLSENFIRPICVVRQNHRIIRADACNLALARNVRRRLVQVAVPA